MNIGDICPFLLRDMGYFSKYLKVYGIPWTPSPFQGLNSKAIHAETWSFTQHGSNCADNQNPDNRAKYYPSLRFAIKLAYTDKDRGSYINLVMAHFPATKLIRHALAISTADSLAMHEKSMAYKDTLSSNGMLSGWGYKTGQTDRQTDSQKET